MNALSLSQQHSVQILFNTGFAHAAQAFSQIIARDVSVETARFVAAEEDIKHAMHARSESTTLITTDIIGEAEGSSYLLLSDQANQALQGICLPTTLNAHQRTIMGEAVLKEIDNIVSAAVITKLSETLGLSIFGGVPQLHNLPSDNTEKMFRESFGQDYENCLLVSTRFLFTDVRQLQPQFFWKFSSEFLHCLESHLSSIRTNSLS